MKKAKIEAVKALMQPTRKRLARVNGIVKTYEYVTTSGKVVDSENIIDLGKGVSPLQTTIKQQ